MSHKLKHYTPYARDRIIRLSKALPAIEIVKIINEEEGIKITRSGVRRLINIYKQSLNKFDASRSGRPKVVSKPIYEFVEEQLTTNNELTGI